MSRNRSHHQSREYNHAVLQQHPPPTKSSPSSASGSETQSPVPQEDQAYHVHTPFEHNARSMQSAHQ